MAQTLKLYKRGTYQERKWYRKILKQPQAIWF